MGKQTYKSDVVLGETYRDTQTGLEGVATAAHFYQHACERITIEVVKKDGDLGEFSFDAPRLEHVDTGAIARSARPGGPARAGESRDRGTGR